MGIEGTGDGRRPDPLVVMMSGKPWDGVRGADRQQAEQLTRYATVLWVDPPISPVTPRRFRPGVGPGVWPRLARAADGIIRLTPVALPGLSRPGIRATTWPLVRSQIRWALRRLGRQPHAVVSFSFDDVLGCWGPDVRDVLYGTDDWVAGGQLMGLDPEWLRAVEQVALRRADTVIAVTPALVERWSGLGADPVLIANGVHSAAYLDVDSAPLPPGLPDLPSPVAGLVGRITARIDIELLESVVDAGVSLLMVGPRNPSWEPQRWALLTSRPTVAHVDEVPFTDLPGYFRAIDVGLTPYLDTPFNRASFPLKTLEYFAAGRPAVSSDLPASRWLADGAGETLPLDSSMLSIASTAADFAAAVTQAAALPRTPEVVEARQRFAARHSWSRRGDVFAAAIGLIPAGSNQGGPMAVGTARAESGERR
ncbi:teichuronic acid biosynthesis glycosyltransferase TuaH [Actinokineospora alba]|uniref:Teichuronic acid biosynthesis glycosyltransferase TuaH n=2 Tax=Actinokineospora alba TaxID=504798 RepID=A0A1H0PHT9_9PSEU|nr:teichuronic acid biosynthesis glycosyltransferase TuaH [Actinokineospora alba]SDI65038.1 teichuronic acid biosynthesis glycosyltransferase TuaH [Actinokineospora alba]SDP04239.1 teichuronic acid biosynthesis glycosyltransferase TuaH [Actinokineospora alba]